MKSSTVEMQSSTVSRALRLSAGGKPFAERRPAYSFMWLKTILRRKPSLPPPEPPDPPVPPDPGTRLGSASHPLLPDSNGGAVILPPSHPSSSCLTPPTDSTSGYSPNPSEVGLAQLDFATPSTPSPPSPAGSSTWSSSSATPRLVLRSTPSSTFGYPPLHQPPRD